MDMATVYPRIPKASGGTGHRGMLRHHGALAEQPWYSRLGAKGESVDQRAHMYSGKLLQKHIGYWLFLDPPALGQRTERHATAVVGSYLRPRTMYTTTQLRRRLEKLIHYMRVLLDFLGTSASPALPSLTHVGVFRCRLRCKGKHAMFTYSRVSSYCRLNIEMYRQFFHAVPTMGSSTSQSSVRKCANAP